MSWKQISRSLKPLVYRGKAFQVDKKFHFLKKSVQVLKKSTLFHFNNSLRSHLFPNVKSEAIHLKHEKQTYREHLFHKIVHDGREQRADVEQNQFLVQRRSFPVGYIVKDKIYDSFCFLWY